MRRKKELQTITSKDVGVLVLESTKKCSVCGEEYILHDSKNPRKTRSGRIFRLPNEWNEKEEIAHKISHVQSPKVRRILSSFMGLSKENRQEIIDFVSKC